MTADTRREIKHYIITTSTHVIDTIDVGRTSIKEKVNQLMNRFISYKSTHFHLSITSLPCWHNITHHICAVAVAPTNSVGIMHQTMLPI